MDRYAEKKAPTFKLVFFLPDTVLHLLKEMPVCIKISKVPPKASESGLSSYFQQILWPRVSSRAVDMDYDSRVVHGGALSALSVFCFHVQVSGSLIASFSRSTLETGW